MSKEAFHTGAGEATGQQFTAEQPAPSPAPMVYNNTAADLKSAEKMFAVGSTPPKMVGLHDTLHIANQLGQQLSVLHQDLYKTGQIHSGLAEARKHLYGDPTLPDEHPDRYGALQLLQQAKHFAPRTEEEAVERGIKLKNTEGLAWHNVEQAGRKLNAAHKALSLVSPDRAEDISVVHNVQGFDYKFTPGKALSHITTSYTPFRTQGKTPKTVNVAGTNVPTIGVKTAIAVDAEKKEIGIEGTDNLPEGVVNAAKKLVKGTKRTRKIERTKGAGSPATGVINQGSSVFNEFDPQIAYSAMEKNAPATDENTPTTKKPTRKSVKATTRGVTVETFGKDVTGGNKPKKNFRSDNPTADKALKNVTNRKRGK